MDSYRDIDDGKLLAYLESIDNRLAAVESSMVAINHEIGMLSGNSKSSIVPILVKFVVFPLILVVGGLVGIRLSFPM